MIVCSTPNGIKVIFSHETGWRHASGLSAQRLTASKLYSVTTMIQKGQIFRCAQRLTASKLYSGDTFTFNIKGPGCAQRLTASKLYSVLEADSDYSRVAVLNA